MTEIDVSAAPFSLAPLAIIGLGANMHKPAQMIREAIRTLKSEPDLLFVASSSLYLTEPQGGPAGQDWYHNAVAFFKTRLEPHDLLTLLLKIESDMGRVRLESCGPRVIDLDLLAWGAAVVDDQPRLVLPHPRMHQRLFVMAPLAELDPAWVHPRLGRSAAELVGEIPPLGQGFRKLSG